MRLFLAVVPDDDAKLELSDSLRTAYPSGLPGRVVRPDHWHLTLRFMAKVDPPTMDRVCAELDTADLGDAFRIRLDGVGAFPRPARAQVMWMGVADGADRLRQLAMAAEEAVLGAGLDPEERPFRPHLTLARFRPAIDARSLLDTEVAGIGWRADHIALFESVFGRGGPSYVLREKFRLA